MTDHHPHIGVDGGETAWHALVQRFRLRYTELSRENGDPDTDIQTFCTRQQILIAIAVEYRLDSIFMSSFQQVPGLPAE